MSELARRTSPYNPLTRFIEGLKDFTQGRQAEIRNGRFKIASNEDGEPVEAPDFIKLQQLGQLAAGAVLKGHLVAPHLYYYVPRKPPLSKSWSMHQAGVKLSHPAAADEFIRVIGVFRGVELVKNVTDPFETQKARLAISIDPLETTPTRAAAYQGFETPTSREQWLISPVGPHVRFTPATARRPHDDRHQGLLLPLEGARYLELAEPAY